MPTGRVLRLGAGALLAMALALGQAQAQDNTGTISGTIADEQGQVLPAAAVTVINERTGLTRSVQTGPRGGFLVSSLPPGGYTIRVELASFRTTELKRTILSAAQRLSLGTIRLAVGLGESLVVEASGTKVNTEDSQHTGLLTSNQIEQIQVKGRDVTTLLRLVPGVRYEDTVESLGESFGTLVPHVSGQRRDWNTIMVDGVLGNEVGQTNRMAQQINLDAVDEIKVLLNTYRAEYGRGGGAQIQIVTKSGGSEYHGDAYYYGRHEKFNANNFFNNRAERDRARYRYNTYGFRLGGPIPGLHKGQDKKFFFFYSIEAPITERPGPLRSYRMPTAAERAGDFSQTVDLNGAPIAIRDPLTGQPFPGNVVPADRIDPNGLALLNLLPLPNVTGNLAYNFERQETADNPKVNNVLRLDWRPTGSDSLYFTYKDWWSDQRGSEVTAGPAKWGWFNTHYLNTDRGVSLNYTKIIRSNLINDAAVGVRRQTEQFDPVDDSDWARLRRADNGFTLGQLYDVNPVGALPKATFNVPVGGGAIQPNLTFENRLVGEGGKAWVFSFRDNLTWIKGNHTFKGGFYVEQLKNSEGPGGVGAGPWAGQFNFNTDNANPLDTRYAFSNALLGVFRDYTEVDALPEVQAKRFLLEWYLQDTWKASRRLTLDYGVRFLWYKPWSTSLPAATFVPERYDPARAPRLYQPARIDNQNVAFDPVTGQVLPNIYVGSFVPGTGDVTNGMVSNEDPDYPKGFRDNQGIHPEPRLGLAYDLTGDGKTSVHASVGLYHNAHITARSMDQSANNPPAVFTPIVYYERMSNLAGAGAGSAVRPSNVFALERDAKTPSSYNWSIGVQRDIGWGTVIDLTYVGNVTRHLELATNLNVVPDGAKFVDENPQNANPQNPANPKADTFLRPYLGYENVILRSHHGTSNYNGLQVQLNRRYIRGFQFAVAYTFAKALGVADDDEQQISSVRPLKEWHYAPLAGTQTHNLVINYTWDLPRASKLFGDNPVVKFLLDDWQLSGENAFASGDWTPVFMTTTNNFDFTGGTGGNGGDAGGGVRVVRPVVVGNPQGGGDAAPGGSGWVDPAAFARPDGRGDIGNAGRYVFRGPGINNWNLSLFKNFSLGDGGRRRLQLRLEAYNLLNHTQFGGSTVNAGTGGQGVDSTVRFDANGNQVNSNFGYATAARNARILQGSIRLSF